MGRIAAPVHGTGCATGAGKARRPGGVPPYNKKTARRCERVVVSDKNAGKMPALPRAELWR